MATTSKVVLILSLQAVLIALSTAEQLSLHPLFVRCTASVPLSADLALSSNKSKVPRAAVGISSSINSTEGSNTTEHESSSVTAVPARTSYNQTSSEVTSILPATNTTTLHPEHNITATPSSPISANSTAMPTSWPNSTTSETSENGNITDAGLTHISVGSTNQSFPWSTTSSMSVATNTTNPTLTENTTFTVSTIPHSPLEVPLGSHDGEMADQRLRVALGVVIPMSSLIMLGAFFAYCRQHAKELNQLRILEPRSNQSHELKTRRKRTHLTYG